MLVLGSVIQATGMVEFEDGLKRLNQSEINPIIDSMNDQASQGHLLDSAHQWY